MARPSVPISERWRDPKSQISDDAAVSAGLSSEFPLLAQPHCNATHNEHHHGRIEGVADGNQQRFERPFDELGHGGKELLEVHGCGLLAQK